VACAGNSITYGSGIAGREVNSYPAQLSVMLGEGYEVRNFGRSGAAMMRKSRLPYWDCEEYRAALDFRPDLVFIKMGTNDSRPEDYARLDEFVQDYMDMIRSFRELPSSPKVTLLLPAPVFGSETEYVSDSVLVNRILPMVRQVACESGCEVINLYNLLIESPGLFNKDLVHPMQSGALAIAQRVCEHIRMKSDAGFRLSGVWPADAKPFSHFGFNGYEFKFKGRTAQIAVPRQAAIGHPWIWRTRFFDSAPQADIALLEKGYHLAYCDVSETFLNDEAMSVWNDFYLLLRDAGLAPKAVMEGMSRGGMYSYRWAAKYPERVAAVYVDAPVLDLKSWPGGMGKSKRSEEVWNDFKKHFGLESDEAAIAWKGNPLDLTAEIAAGGYPMLHIVGDADETVPIAENTTPFEEKIKAAGGEISVIHKKDIGHHPPGLQNPRPVVDFILKATGYWETQRRQDFPAEAYESEAYKNDRARGITLPKTDFHYQKTRYYVEEDPDPDYLHASEKAYEDFRDIKFAVRIHWGIYSMKGMSGASWGFLGLSNEKKQEYNELYKTFNPVQFDADEWMDLFKRSGIRAFAFTTKHHEGFSMFHTKTRVKQRANYLNPADKIIEPCDLAYSIEETPFKRDIVRELCEAAHRKDIKIDLYFSHPDWYDADFRPYNYHPLTTPYYLEYNGDYGFETGTRKWSAITPELSQEEKARLIARHREQLRELLTNYGKIDMLCLDQWMGKDLWPEMRETVKMMRELQPDVMLRCRGTGNYGDFYTPEGFVPGAKGNTNMPWMTIDALASSFSYDANGNKYKGAAWIIHNLIDAVSKGGNFMVGIGPNATGRFHPKAVEQLEETGRWLAVNGAGIYGTKFRETYREGDLRFTQSKDEKQVFVFTEQWPGTALTVESLSLQKGSKIYLLGYKKALKWSATDKGIKIEIPDSLQSPENRPCEYAWAFRFEIK
jgi:alpha-L-fucosidase